VYASVRYTGFDGRCCDKRWRVAELRVAVLPEELLPLLAWLMWERARLISERVAYEVVLGAAVLGLE
jgi:hypothetical protein